MWEIGCRKEFVVDVRKSIFLKCNRWMSESGNVLSVTFLWLDVWFSIIAWGHIFQTYMYPVGSSTCIVESPGRSFWFCNTHQDAGIICLELQCPPRNRIWFRIVADVFSNLETSQLLKLPAQLRTHLLHTWENWDPNIHNSIPLCLRNRYFFKICYNLKFQRRIRFWIFKRRFFNRYFQIFGLEDK